MRETLVTRSAHTGKQWAIPLMEEEAHDLDPLIDAIYEAMEYRRQMISEHGGPAVSSTWATGVFDFGQDTLVIRVEVLIGNE